MKICTKCHNEYPATTEYYYARKERPSGLMSHCKKCSVKKSSVWNKANPDKRKANKAKCYWKNPKADNDRSKKWREANKERHHENTKKWIEANQERFKAKKTEWARNNIEKCRESWRKYATKRSNSPKWRMSNSISRRIAKSIISGKCGSSWESVVGFTLLEFIAHMEKQFIHGMSWENYGAWHVDHILPVSSFMFSSLSDSEFKKCWSLKNLQPLWAYDNLSKGAKVA